MQFSDILNDREFYGGSLCVSVNNTLVCSNSTNVLNMFLVSKTNVRKAVRKVGINTVCGPDNNPAFL